MPHSLGDFIRERRQDLGLTQEQLAERVGDGMRQAEISRLEHNRILLPRRTRLEQLALALEVSLGDLLVATGWLEEHQSDWVNRPDGLDGSDGHHEEILGGMSETAEYIADIQAMMGEMNQKLAEAENIMATILRRTSGQGNNTGTVKPPIGSMKQWETMSTMAI